MSKIKQMLNWLLSIIGLKIIRLELYELMNSFEPYFRFFNILDSSDAAKDFLKLLELSKSQISQDLFVLTHLGFKRDGYFVEFGATNGLDLSNTWLLEKEFDWNGILAEPGKIWHEDLVKNRSSVIEKKAVWGTSNEKLTFLESVAPEMSTIAMFSNIDNHKREGSTYEVDTISLMDLLEKHNAPREIDYLSIDTEGSEFDILKNFDFDYYKIKVITVEHNFTKNREKIFHLLTEAGYWQVMKSISTQDEWYVLEKH
jgi:FkbM family methyltransferase